jgi:hypothetical protein
MKKLAILVVALLTFPAWAAVYTDATGDLGSTFTGFPHLDISAVEVTNDLNEISFKFTLVGDIAATNWGKYVVVIDSIPAAGDTSNQNNGWGRNHQLNAGTDITLAGWVDSGGGFEARHWDGGGWPLDGATYNSTPGMVLSLQQYSVSYTVPLALVGLTPGQTILFEGFSTAGGDDPGVDVVSSPNVTVNNWGDFSVSNGVSYTLVPEPVSFVLLALGALLRRR